LQGFDGLLMQRGAEARCDWVGVKNQDPHHSNPCVRDFSSIRSSRPNILTTLRCIQLTTNIRRRAEKGISSGRVLFGAQRA
jgi:hypothetical protein